jgi:hypothetical protein
MPDLGVTVSFDDVQDWEKPVFSGNGVCLATNAFYSLAWYYASSGSAMWDFMRRAFKTSANKYVLVTKPNPSHPAYVKNAYGSACWSCPYPWIFDDPEDDTFVDFLGAPLLATGGSNQQCLIELSPQNKTESVTFRELQMWGNNTCLYGVWKRGGARIHYQGTVFATQFIRSAFQYNNDLFSGDEDDFGDLIQIADCGDTPLNIYAPNQVPNGYIKQLFSNGNKGIYCTASVTAGALTALTPQTISATSGTYNSGTGIVTLTFSQTISIYGGKNIQVQGASGTGSFASINGCFVSTTGTANSISYFVGTGLTLTITSANLWTTPQYFAQNSAGYGGLPALGFNGGTYNSGTGLLTLTTSAPHNLSVGATVNITVLQTYNEAYAGQALTSPATGTWATVAGTTGSTLVVNIGTGLTVTLGSGLVNYVGVSTNQLLYVYSLSGTGAGGIVVPTVDANNNITGIASISNAGYGFTNNETVIVTGVQSLLNLSGAIRKYFVGHIEENISTLSSNLVQVANQMVTLDTDSTSNSGVFNVTIGEIVITGGTGRCYVSGKNTGAIASAGGKWHTVVYGPNINVIFPQDTTRYNYEIFYNADFIFMGARGNFKYVANIGTGASTSPKGLFQSTPRSTVAGSSNGTQFDKVTLQSYSTLGNGSATGIQVTNYTGDISNKPVRFIGQSGTLYFDGYIWYNAGTWGINTFSIGSATQTVLTDLSNSTVQAGLASGFLYVSPYNGVFWFYNKTGSAVLFNAYVDL